MGENETLAYAKNWGLLTVIVIEIEMHFFMIFAIFKSPLMIQNNFLDLNYLIGFGALRGY